MWCADPHQVHHGHVHEGAVKANDEQGQRNDKRAVQPDFILLTI